MSTSHIDVYPVCKGFLYLSEVMYYLPSNTNIFRGLFDAVE
jgi:hypothetical protein